MHCELGSYSNVMVQKFCQVCPENWVATSAGSSSCTPSFSGSLANSAHDTCIPTISAHLTFPTSLSRNYDDDILKFVRRGTEAWFAARYSCHSVVKSTIHDLSWDMIPTEFDSTGIWLSTFAKTTEAFASSACDDENDSYTPSLNLVHPTNSLCNNMRISGNACTVLWTFTQKQTVSFVRIAWNAWSTNVRCMTVDALQSHDKSFSVKYTEQSKRSPSPSTWCK